MIKKILLFAILATTVFAAPASDSIDSPIPECYPCDEDFPPPPPPPAPGLPACYPNCG